MILFRLQSNQSEREVRLQVTRALRVLSFGRAPLEEEAA